jgi:hypothetical protein
MILRNATIKYKGYDPSTLSKGSHKRICVSCDICGRVRWQRIYAVRSLCKSCSHSGENNSQYGMTGELSPNFGKEFSEEHKRKIGLGHKNKKVSIETRKKIYKASKSRKHTEETKRKISKNHPDQRGLLNHNWKGGISGNREHVLPINQCLQINKRFKDSNAHHISSDVVVYIPKELHQHIKHSLKNGKNMYEMNMLSLQYIRGWL